MEASSWEEACEHLQCSTRLVACVLVVVLVPLGAFCHLLLQILQGLVACVLVEVLGPLEVSLHLLLQILQGLVSCGFGGNGCIIDVSGVDFV